MEQDHLDFLQNYQKSLFSENATANQRASIQRKCLAQMYNFSLGNADEETTCHLLEKNLQRYYDIIDKDASKSTFAHNDRVKRILQENNISAPVELNSNLANIDLKPLVTSQSCCSEAEHINERDYLGFMAAIRKNEAQVPTTQLRKVARNFTPQTSFQDKKREERNIVRSYSEEMPKVSHFKSAREELHIQNIKKNGVGAGLGNNAGRRRNLGMRRNVNTKFVPPLLSNYTSGGGAEEAPKSAEWPEEVDERLKNIDPKMVELIKSEIMEVGSTIEWDDIVGLEFAKTAIQEAVVWPMLRPDIFTGLRRPPKGILLFGPPGTGKTLIGKCVASQSKSTFFSISASSLTSKWVGEGEKMVRALFAVARSCQPAVVFIDEVDSLLSQRSDSEHESSRRIKTEFLVQLDGATTESEERVLLIGATNRPHELDEAARRRFVKRLYIPLPECRARLDLVAKLICNERHTLGGADLEKIAELADGYSGADIRNLCSEASLGPLRSLSMSFIEKMAAEDVPPLKMEDFQQAFHRVKASVSPNDLKLYAQWDATYGAGL